jgi:uncharacterized phage protein (TIGR01671 family)
MTTIKFRAWDDGKMIYEKDIIHLSMEDNLILRLAKFRNDSQVMQFTGLTDKNGKEIYEGDVLITANGQKSTIVFGEYPYKYEQDEGNDSLDKSIGFFFNSLSADYYQPFGECASGGGIQYEIIGNIYETPELLK